MRHFYLRALIVQRMGRPIGAWPMALMLKTLAGRGEGCALQACAALRVRLAGDINAKMDSTSLDELLESIKSELTRLGPLIGLEVVRPRGQCPACAQTRFAH